MLSEFFPLTATTAIFFPGMNVLEFLGSIIHDFIDIE